MLQWNTSSENKLPPPIGVSAPRGGLSWNKRSGLGQTPTYTECFANDPNFDGCWRDMFRQAQLECQQSTSPYADYNACVDARARQHANQVCIPACEAYLRGSGDFPWGVYSAETCDVQREINSILTNASVARGQKAAGDTYNPIAEDCKMGPATCGAADFLGMGTPTTCAGRPWTTPTKTGTGGGGGPVTGGGTKSRSGVGAAILAGFVLVAGSVALIRSG
jgi:hypothetical protein